MVITYVCVEVFFESFDGGSRMNFEKCFIK